jgi:uncharacterized protein (DUF433 family)
MTVQDKLETLSLVRESLDGDVYEYYPLGQHIVAAPDVCHGEPTFKYSRISVGFILDRLKAGETIEALVAAYGGRLSREALEEALQLAEEKPREFFLQRFPPVDAAG